MGIFRVYEYLFVILFFFMFEEFLKKSFKREREYFSLGVKELGSEIKNMSVKWMMIVLGYI